MATGTMSRRNLVVLILAIAVPSSIAGFLSPTSVRSFSFRLTVQGKPKQPKPRRQFGNRRRDGESDPTWSVFEEDYVEVEDEEDDEPNFNYLLEQRRRASTRSRVGVTKDYMWKSGKSIDDLEKSMIKRHGANPGAGDDEEDEFFQRNSLKSSVQKTKRRRPDAVLDPWEKAQQKTKSSSRRGRGGDINNRQMMNVRSDQRGLQQKRGDSLRDTEPKRDFTGDDFYDEDDEGYEYKSSASYESEDHIGRLIAPKPFDELSRRSRSRPSDALCDSSPGFFFNPDAVASKQASIETRSPKAPPKERSKKKAQMSDSNGTEKEANPSRRKMSQRKQIPLQLKDSNGNSMLLTLSQAQQIFDESRVHKSSRNKDEDTEEGVSHWEDLGIVSPLLLSNLESMDCPNPLHVQNQACPSILTGNDVLIGTYTGSGKTLAFLTPLCQRLLMEGVVPKDGVKVIIVAPGRELASQIVSVARDLLAGAGLSVVLAIGGTTFSRNVENLRKKKPTIVVGTPGRIAELTVGKPGERRGRLNVGPLESIVLDEFDALLEYKAHRDPTASLLSLLKRRHRDSLQSIMCSATASDLVGSDKLNSFLRPGYAKAFADQDDELVTDGNEKTTRVSKTVIHGVMHVKHPLLALEAIRKILHTEPFPDQVLLFVGNSQRAQTVVDQLASKGIIAAALHGGVKGDKMDRAEVSKALREGYVGLVVATELAARGLDAPQLTHVINLDLPTDASHYAHRAGRCGRGGRPGVVINLTMGVKERNVPQRFADKLGIEMHTVEPRDGLLKIVDPKTIDLEETR